MRPRWLSSLHLVKPCWICLLIDADTIGEDVDRELRGLGMEPLRENGHCYRMKTDEDWNLPWQRLYACMTRYRLDGSSHASIIAGEEEPSLQEAVLHQLSTADTQKISEQLWLLHAITKQRLTCHFQPVIDRKGNVYGYESLVRAAKEDGTPVSGGAIFQASKLLRIEHLIDRHLHELAIQCYSELELNGLLFINLVPGFIQRPEFYFGGLAEAAKRYQFDPRKIVLDCSNSENPRDIQHLQSITRYCHSQGHLVSLDDIESEAAARRILAQMQPDFIKLDMRLVQRAEEAEAMQTINELVDLTRSTACTLIAEGVETEAIYEVLLDAGISLFQGYLFSPPGAAMGTQNCTAAQPANTRKRR